MNRLAAEQNAGREAAKAELERVERDLDKLIEAILDGVPGARLKDKIAALEARKEALEAQLADGDGGSAQVHLHPNMSAYYRSQIHRLRAMLTGETGKAEAVDALRALIDYIELTPHTLPDGRTTLTARLHGSLAGILSMSLEGDKPLGSPEVSGGGSGSALSVVKLVAGARLRLFLPLISKRFWRKPTSFFSCSMPMTSPRGDTRSESVTTWSHRDRPITLPASVTRRARNRRHEARRRMQRQQPQQDLRAVRAA
ncbi:MAG: hypothetical protein AAFR84_13680 [Pseudomonadota bacterium]